LKGDIVLNATRVPHPGDGAVHWHIQCGRVEEIVPDCHRHAAVPCITGPGRGAVTGAAKYGSGHRSELMSPFHRDAPE
jgi:hypothetical protein